MGFGRSTFYDIPDVRARDLTIVARSIGPSARANGRLTRSISTRSAHYSTSPEFVCGASRMAAEARSHVDDSV